MGLIADVKDAVATLFDDVLDDIPQTLTYRSSDVADGDAEVFNPALGAGSPTTADDYTDHTIKAVQGKVEAEHLLQGMAQGSEMKWIIKGKDFTATPKIGDMIVLNSKDLPVYKVRQIPTEAIWIVYVSGGTLDA